MATTHFLIITTGFAFGWLACHLFSRNRRQEDTKKRRRAIPAGTENTRKPGRPKKAKQDPAPTLPGVAMSFPIE